MTEDPPKVVSLNRSTVINQNWLWVPNPHIIEQLQKMLAAAEAGTLQGLFAVGWNTDNSIMSGWQGAESAAFTLLGGIEQCKMEYLLKEFQRRT